MTFAHLVLGLPRPGPGFGNCGLSERRKALASGGVASLGCKGNGGVQNEVSLETRSRSFRREISGQARVRVMKGPAVANGQVRSGVEVPVTCYQILGLPEQAEKDEIVKAAMELKNSQIEDGYTADVIISRQDLLMDVRDKLLFELDYAGNIKENIPPKSILHIPWNWLPGALCLLQEVGQEKLVLDIGRAAVQLPDAKPYVHDLLVSMALSECSIAKTGFEKSKVSEGFEALARAQYLLRSKISLGKMPLLSQIEESLEELAPACTLEILDMPRTPDNAERRRGAISALRELLRQGLDVESSCRVQDWSCFLSQAMNKLMATEIVDLLSWDSLAVSRKNKKSLESQNQRAVIDYNCFYMGMIAHIALGFSKRQIDKIARAKTICECLLASDGVDLKFEEAFCSFLLGQGDGTAAIGKLHQLEVNGNSTLRTFDPTTVRDNKVKGTVNQLLETWLKDAVLCLFPDTRDCSPSLANVFGGPKQILSVGKQKIGNMKRVPSTSYRPPSFVLFPVHGASAEQKAHINSTRHLGEAVKQLAPADLQSQPALVKGPGSPSGACFQLKRNLGINHTESLKGWYLVGDIAGKAVSTTLAGCFLLGAFKLFNMQFIHTKFSHKWHSGHPMSQEALAWTMSQHSGLKSASGFIDRNIWAQLRNLLIPFRRHLKHQKDAETLQNSWPTDDLSLLPAVAGNLLQMEQMAVEEAEALVKQWQDIKAVALGPSYKIQALSEILAESMLSKWQDLAHSAKARSCFWRFVLLHLSIQRADIISDGVGSEIAEIEGVLEEAAELVDESQLNKPSYYSTYKVKYILKRQDDGSWRFCRGSIQNQDNK
ncbi:plastid division protein CDP1, chloroplastic isoform X2 [Elaeis guineensis]|uniref:Plastid division protein CDP1, chloroplastic isoform X2 n=1 Tax=Elaeis guineensis var. tenera TaxID=51953 RepID=A0A6I9S1F9_ELAGV|nr:plastid division protein CDP1, chloroplastic isoform X2 [Elaeis guineensis]